MSLEGIKLKRSKKSELLIGVMIGIYGNWIIAIVERLEKTDMTSIMLFAFSFFPFILYFLEIFTEIEKQIWVKLTSLKTLLGLIYLMMIFASLWISGLWESQPLLSWTGIVLWTVLMSVERRALM